MSLPYSDNITALNAVKVTTTSDLIDVSKRQVRSIQFDSTVTSGTATFTVLVSNSSTGTNNFVTYNRLTDNLANAITEGDVRVGSYTVSATESKVYFFPAGDYFRYMQVKLSVNASSGTGSFTAVIQCAG